VTNLSKGRECKPYTVHIG